MSDLVTNTNELQRVLSELGSRVVDPSQLETENKTIIGAINELKSGKVSSIDYLTQPDTKMHEIFGYIREKGLTGRWVVLNLLGYETGVYGLGLNWYGADVYGLYGIDLQHGAIASNTNSWTDVPISNFKNSFIYPINSDSLPSELMYTQVEYLNTDVKTIVGAINSLQDILNEGGADGEDGIGISDITKTSTSGKVDTYTITLTDGNTKTFTVTNGEDGRPGSPGLNGSDGDDGVGISNITKTNTSGLVDTYTITLTNGKTKTFTVTNGSNGNNGTNATITGATASVDANVGTPSVTVTAGGTASARTFDFAFKNLKGEKGDKPIKGTDYFTSTEIDSIATQAAGKINLSSYATQQWVTDQGYTANTGTVTSVGLSVPTGFSTSSSPITSNGTITLSFADGYSLPTTAKQNNWDTAYGWGNHANAGYLTSGNGDLAFASGAEGKGWSSLSIGKVSKYGVLTIYKDNTFLDIKVGGTLENYAELMIPVSGGTIATQDWVSAGYVTQNTEQEITAKKTFVLTGSTQEVEVSNTKVRLADNDKGFDLQYNTTYKALEFVFN